MLRNSRQAAAVCLPRTLQAGCWCRSCLEGYKASIMIMKWTVSDVYNWHIDLPIPVARWVFAIAVHCISHPNDSGAI